jgi:hypothetical protein
MTKDEICGLLRQIHDVLAMQSETNQVKSTSDYERGVIDGMLKQVQSSVDKAVNAMAKRPWAGLTWAGLTDEEAMQIWEGIIKYAPGEVRLKDFARAIEAKLKEKNA